MEVLVTLLTVEVFSTFLLSGGGLILYSHPSLPTHMTGLRGVPGVNSPHTVLGVSEGLSHVANGVNDLPPQVRVQVV